MEHSLFIMHHNYVALQLIKTQKLIPTQVKGKISLLKLSSENNLISCLGLAILQILIDHKMNIDCTDGQQRTPFIWAASAGLKDNHYNFVFFSYNRTIRQS